MDWRKTLQKSSWMNEGDRELARRFGEDAVQHDIGPLRIVKNLSDLASAHRTSNRGLAAMVKDMEAMRKTITAINECKTYEWHTKKDMKQVLGSLYNFLHNKDRSMKYASRELKELVRHKIRASDKRLAKPVILRSEMREMVKFADIQDKALISLLFESGMRNGEFSQLRRSDIKQIKEGLEVRVPAGKTGEREVVVVEAARYVLAWLDQHPLRGSDDFPLWVYSLHEHGQRKGKPVVRQLTAPGIAKRIRLVVSKLNESRRRQGVPLLEKAIHPHNFRHSRATELGGEPGMTEPILCKIFGWEIGSPTPRTYLHLTPDMVKRAILRTYGRAPPDKPAEIITSQTCSRCHEDNPLTAAHCMRCGADLKSGEMPSKIERMEEQMRQMKRQMDKMMTAAAHGTVLRAKRRAEEMIKTEND